MSNIYNIKPTVLIVKKCNSTGLLYFHKTFRLHMLESYRGSGVDWTEHLDKNGNNWSNIWISEPFTKSNVIRDFAMKFSEDHNIVESQYWANRVPETGLDNLYAEHLVMDYEEIGKKQSKTKTSAEWKSKNHILCEHCNKNIAPHVYTRWHGNNCKKSPNYNPDSNDMLRGKHRNANPITIDGITYSCEKDAREALDISVHHFNKFYKN